MEAGHVMFLSPGRWNIAATRGRSHSAEGASGIFSHKSVFSFLDLPMLIKESGIENAARPAWAGWSIEVNERPVGKFRSLLCVGAVRIGAEIKAAVQQNISIGMERIGIDKDRRVMRGVQRLITEYQFFRVPFQWQTCLQRL